MRRIVLVGYGVAGLTAADALREAGFDGELTIVGEEPSTPYSRPALSKALLSDAAGTADLSFLELPAPAHGATELLGRRAVDLRPGERSVLLDDGHTLEYDGLVIATGARPRRLTAGPEEFTLRNLPEALTLRTRLAARPRVTVLGGGPLGMEVASGARGLGCAVTVVSRGTPMAAQAGRFLGRLCARAAVDHGVRLVDDVAVGVESGATGAVPADAGVVVALGSGEKLETQLLVTAVGDELNDEWLAGSGLLRDGRLVVDDRGLVAPGVAAAGDIAWHRTLAGPRRVPLWTQAIEQARVAAQGLLHGAAAEPFVPRPYFWTEQFGLQLRMAGPVPRGEPVVVDGDPDDGSALLHWEAGGPGSPGTAAAMNYRIPVPRLRRLAAAAPAAA